MKIKRGFTIMLCILLSAVILSGCSVASDYREADALSYSVEDVSAIKIAYGAGDVRFFRSDGDQLILKEYMTVVKDRYRAKVESGDGTIGIKEGSKPLFGGFSRYAEIYLPDNFKGELTVTTSHGEINCSDIQLNLSALRFDTSAGAVRLSNVEADSVYLSTTHGNMYLGELTAETVRLETTHGSVECEALRGNTTYTTTHGSFRVKHAEGCGSFTVNNTGDLQIDFAEVKGNISFYNKNGNIKVALPEQFDFTFSATTKNGSVRTSFQSALTVDGKSFYGNVGENPAFRVSAQTVNGAIEVNRTNG